MRVHLIVVISFMRRYFHYSLHVFVIMFVFKAAPMWSLLIPAFNDIRAGQIRYLCSFCTFETTKWLFQAEIMTAENSIMQYILVFPCGTCACEIIYNGTWYQ